MRRSPSTSSVPSPYYVLAAEIEFYVSSLQFSSLHSLLSLLDLSSKQQELYVSKANTTINQGTIVRTCADTVSMELLIDDVDSVNSSWMVI